MAAGGIKCEILFGQAVRRPFKINTEYSINRIYASVQNAGQKQNDN